MNDHITITGTVGSDPEAKVSQSTQTPWTSFRFVTNQRRRTPDGSWEDVNSNWYTVTCFRNLSKHVSSCVKTGERLIITGRLELQKTGSDEARRVWPQIVASAIGHDLNFGIATPERRSRPAASEPAEPADESVPTSIAELSAQFEVDPGTGEVRDDRERELATVGAGAPSGSEAVDGESVDLDPPF